jgi:hypothetical protein
MTTRQSRALGMTVRAAPMQRCACVNYPGTRDAGLARLVAGRISLVGGSRMALARCAFNHPGCAKEARDSVVKEKWYQLRERVCCPTCLGIEADKAINTRD